MLCLEVRPVTFDSIISKLGEVVEGEDADVACTHEVESEGLDAMI